MNVEELLNTWNDAWSTQYASNPDVTFEFEWRFGSFTRNQHFVSDIPVSIFQQWKKSPLPWQHIQYQDEWWVKPSESPQALPDTVRRRIMQDSMVDSIPLVRKTKEFGFEDRHHGCRVVRNREDVVTPDLSLYHVARRSDTQVHVFERQLATGKYAISLIEENIQGGKEGGKEGSKAHRVEIEFSPVIKKRKSAIPAFPRQELLDDFKCLHTALTLTWLWNQLQQCFPGKITFPLQWGTKASIASPPDAAWMKSSACALTPLTDGQRGYLFIYNAHHLCWITVHGQVTLLSPWNDIGCARRCLLDVESSRNHFWVRDILMDQGKLLYRTPLMSRLTALDRYARNFHHWTHIVHAKPWFFTCQQHFSFGTSLSNWDTLWDTIWTKRHELEVKPEGVLFYGLRDSPTRNLLWRPFHTLTVIHRDGALWVRQNETHVPIELDTVELPTGTVELALSSSWQLLRVVEDSLASTWDDFERVRQPVLDWSQELDSSEECPSFARWRHFLDSQRLYHQLSPRISTMEAWESWVKTLPNSVVFLFPDAQTILQKEWAMPDTNYVRMHLEGTPDDYQQMQRVRDRFRKSTDDWTRYTQRWLYLPYGPKLHIDWKQGHQEVTHLIFLSDLIALMKPFGYSLSSSRLCHISELSEFASCFTFATFHKGACCPLRPPAL